MSRCSPDSTRRAAHSSHIGWDPVGVKSGCPGGCSRAPQGPPETYGRLPLWRVGCGESCGGRTGSDVARTAHGGVPRHKRPIVPSIGATPHWVGGCGGRRASGRWSSAARWASRFSGISLSCRGCVDQLATCGVCPVAVGDCPRRGRGGGRRAQLLKGEGVRVDAFSNRPRPLMLDEDLVGQGVQVVVDGGWGRGSGAGGGGGRGSGAGGGQEHLHDVRAGRGAVHGGPCVRVSRVRLSGRAVM